MSKTCPNCGNIFDDSSNICSRCGMQYIEEQPQPANNAYNYGSNQQYGQYDQSYQQQYNQYGQPYQQGYGAPVQTDSQMTLGSWVGTVLLTNLLGLISIILLFVWGFSDSTPPAKKNYCRAMLIYRGIVLGITILLFIIIFATGFSLNVFDYYYY